MAVSEDLSWPPRGKSQWPLTPKRREFLEAAKHGRARLRDSDGISIVALPETELEALDAIAQWSANHQRLTALLAANRRLTATDLGPLAWLRAFDREDQLEFCDELQDSLIHAISTLNGGEIMETVTPLRRVKF